jgi:hypothetical protein
LLAIMRAARLAGDRDLERAPRRELAERWVSRSLSGGLGLRRRTVANSTLASKLTPPQVAERDQVSPDKVLGWFRAGELRAVNVATRTTGRPRYRIDVADLLAFEQRRAAVQTPVPRHRRTKAVDVTEYF